MFVEFSHKAIYHSARNKSSARAHAACPFFNCSLQLTGLGLERGAGGGEGRVLTSFSLDGSIRSWLFKPACLGKKEQTWGKRGGGWAAAERWQWCVFACHGRKGRLIRNEWRREREMAWKNETHRWAEGEQETISERAIRVTDWTPLSRSVSRGETPTPHTPRLLFLVSVLCKLLHQSPLLTTQGVN